MSSNRTFWFKANIRWQSGQDMGAGLSELQFAGKKREGIGFATQKSPPSNTDSTAGNYTSSASQCWAGCWGISTEIPLKLASFIRISHHRYVARYWSIISTHTKCATNIPHLSLRDAIINILDKFPLLNTLKNILTVHHSCAFP